MNAPSKTYAEGQLIPHGFEVVDCSLHPIFGHVTGITVFHAGKSILSDLKCVCPAPEHHITALGCPIHHSGSPGGSGPILDLIREVS